MNNKMRLTVLSVSLLMIAGLASAIDLNSSKSLQYYGNGSALDFEVEKDGDMRVNGDLRLPNGHTLRGENSNWLYLRSGIGSTTYSDMALGQLWVNNQIQGAGSQIDMADPVDMQSNKILNLATPTANSDAATKGYVDSSDDTIADDQALNEVLAQGNSAGSYNINMSGNMLLNLASGSINEGWIAQNTLDDSEVQDNALTAGSLAGNSVTNSELDNNDRFTVEGMTISSTNDGKLDLTSTDVGSTGGTPEGGWNYIEFRDGQGDRQGYFGIDTAGNFQFSPEVSGANIEAMRDLNLRGNTLLNANLESGSVDEGEINQNTLDDSEIQDNSLTAGSLAGNSVTNSELDNSDNFVVNRIYSDNHGVGGSPSIAMAVGDTDTGLHSTSDGVLDFYSNSAEQMTLSNGEFYVNDTRISFGNSKGIRMGIYSNYASNNLVIEGRDPDQKIELTDGGSYNFYSYYSGTTPVFQVDSQGTDDARVHLRGATELDMHGNAIMNLASGSLQEGWMAQNSLDDSEIQDNSLTEASLAADSVGASELIDNSIEDSELQDNVIDNSEIQNGASFTFGGVTNTGNLDLRGNLQDTSDQNIMVSGGGNDGALMTLDKTLNSPDEWGMLIQMDGDGDDDIPIEVRADGDGSAAANENKTVFMVDGSGRTAIGMERDHDAGTHTSSEKQGRMLEVGGATSIYGQLDMESNKITNLADPTNAQDAVTKSYVDGSDDTIADNQNLNEVLGQGNSAGSQDIVNVGSRADTDIGDVTGLNGINDSNAAGIKTAWDTDYAFFGLRDYGADRKDVVIANEQTADNIRLQVAGNDRLVATGGGEVDIPNGNLDLNGNNLNNPNNINFNSGEQITSGTDLRISSDSGYIDFRPSDNSHGLIVRDYDGSSTSWGGIRVVNSDRMEFRMDGGNYGNSLVVKDNDNVGIGTTTPGSKLEVQGSAKVASSGTSMNVEGDGDVVITLG